jgi:hypothetical protein
VAALDYWDDERWVLMLEHVDEFVAASEKYPLPSE